MWSISYPADKHYKSTAYENAMQVFATPEKLVNLYVFANAAQELYLLVLDSNDGVHAPAAANPGTVYPVGGAGQDGYVAIGTHGGDQFKKGLWVGAYTTAALAVAGGAPDAGNVLWIKADWMRGYIADPAKL